MPGPLLSHTLGLTSNISSHRVVVAEPSKVFSQVLVVVRMPSLLKFGSDYYYSENFKMGRVMTVWR